MWYLIGLIISLIILILIPCFRFRDHWNRALTESIMKEVSISAFICEHICCALLSKPLNYHAYKQAVFHYTEETTGEIILLIACLIFMLCLWPVIFPLLFVFHGFSWVLYKIEQKVQQKIQDTQSK